MEQTEGQTDRRTLDRFIDPAPHITQAVYNKSPRLQNDVQ